MWEEIYVSVFNEYRFGDDYMDKQLWHASLEELQRWPESALFNEATIRPVLEFWRIQVAKTEERYSYRPGARYAS